MKVLVSALLLGCSAATAPESEAPDPRACEAPSLRVAQDLDATALIAAPASPPWIDDPSWGGPGIALADLDADGWLDALLASPTGAARVLWNEEGVLVPDATRAVPSANGVAVADFDGDGLLDAWVGRRQGYPDLVLTDGLWAVAELPDSVGHSVTGSVADADNDGDVDLFVARHVPHPDIDAILSGAVSGGGNALYLTDGDVVGAGAGVLPAELADGLSFQGAWLDADADADLDLYLVNDFGAYLDPNVLLRREGDTLVRDPDCGCELAIFGMGAAVADYDGEGSPDLFVTDIGTPSLLLGDGAGAWYEAAAAMGIVVPFDEERMASWGTAPVDLDLDGWDDIVAVYGPTEFWGSPNRIMDSAGNVGYESFAQRDLFLRNDGGAGFTEVDVGFDDTRVGRTVAVGDLDRDGRPDLVTAGWELAGEPYVRVSMAEGGCGPGVTVIGSAADIGARVTVEVGGRARTHWLLPSTSFSQSAPELYLGLGEAHAAERIVVERRGEVLIDAHDVPAGATLRVGP